MKFITHTVVKCMIGKITKTSSGHRRVQGHVLGAMMLFEGNCINLSHIVTSSIILLNEAQSLSVGDKSGRLKRTQVKDHMRKKRMKWTGNTGCAESPQAARKAPDAPQVNMGLIYLCFFFEKPEADILSGKELNISFQRCLLKLLLFNILLNFFASIIREIMRIIRCVI